MLSFNVRAVIASVRLVAKADEDRHSSWWIERQATTGYETNGLVLIASPPLAALDPRRERVKLVQIVYAK